MLFLICCQLNKETFFIFKKPSLLRWLFCFCGLISSTGPKIFISWWFLLLIHLLLYSGINLNASFQGVARQTA